MDGDASIRDDDDVAGVGLDELLRLADDPDSVIAHALRRLHDELDAGSPAVSAFQSSF